MMLLGRLAGPAGSIECLVGVDKNRVVVVAQDDLSKYSWPIDDVRMASSMRELVLGADATYRFTPDLPDRFRWVMTAALQEAEARPTPWWRRRKPANVRGLARKLTPDELAA